jgi:hypothetical protein
VSEQCFYIEKCRVVKLLELHRLESLCFSLKNLRKARSFDPVDDGRCARIDTSHNAKENCEKRIRVNQVKDISSTARGCPCHLRSIRLLSRRDLSDERAIIELAMQVNEAIKRNLRDRIILCNQEVYSHLTALSEEIAATVASIQQRMPSFRFAAGNVSDSKTQSLLSSSSSSSLSLLLSNTLMEY